MLVRKSYPPSYVAAVRTRFHDQLEALAALDAADDAFARGYAPVLVLALEGCFVHRMRGQEGRSGPLQRLRSLSESIAEGDPVDVGVEEFARLCDAVLAEIEARFPDA
jgi:hypothetical protein